MKRRDLLERIRSAGAEVRTHTAAAENAREVFYRLLKQGRRQGLSLRVLAEAAGVSDVRVQQVTREKESE